MRDGGCWQDRDFEDQERVEGLASCHTRGRHNRGRHKLRTGRLHAGLGLSFIRPCSLFEITQGERLLNRLEEVRATLDPDVSLALRAKHVLAPSGQFGHPLRLCRCGSRG